MEAELELFRNKAEQEYDKKEQNLDLNREILKLKFEKDQQREKLEKIVKKLD